MAVVKLIVPTTLRNYTGRNSELSLTGNTVLDIFKALAEQYPDTKNIIFDANEKPMVFINVFIGTTNIKQIDGFDTVLKDGDTLTLIPAIAGGAITESVISKEREKENKLDNDEILRYSRHLLLREVGVKGQKKLKSAKVLIAGLGGLGAPLAQYLAAAGVGTIGLVDFDKVDTTNLQRQVIHGTRDVNRPKVASAKDSIRAINPKVKVEVFNEMLTSDNVLDILSGWDIVADATDNYVARYLINDACSILGIPDVFGAMYQFEGQVSVFYAKYGPCYRCVYPAPPPAGLVPTCSQGGVLGVLAGIIGSFQANEVIKLIVGGGESLIGKILSIDAWNNRYQVFDVAKDKECHICGERAEIKNIEEIDYQELCGLKVEEEEPILAIEAIELKKRLDSGEEINLIDVREPHEQAIVQFPGAKYIPIGQLARRQEELNPNVDTIFICKEGKRSILAIKTLKEAGYKGACYNLKDGLNTWARDVDKSFPQY